MWLIDLEFIFAFNSRQFRIDRVYIMCTAILKFSRAKFMEWKYQIYVLREPKKHITAVSAYICVSTSPLSEVAPHMCTELNTSRSLQFCRIQVIATQQYTLYIGTIKINIIFQVQYMKTSLRKKKPLLFTVYVFERLRYRRREWAMRKRVQSKCNKIDQRIRYNFAEGKSRHIQTWNCNKHD